MSRIDEMRANAERDDDGDLVFTEQIDHGGHTETVETNLTALFTPGDRRSGNIDLLLTEAQLAAGGRDLDNPARPMTADVAEDVIARLDEGVRPAWEVCG